MSVYRDIKTSRNLTWAGVVVGYGLAGGIAVANFNTANGTLLSALAFAAFLSLPPSMAVVSLDRRPSLLTLATMSALVQGVLMITSIGLLEIVPAILWYLAAQRRPKPAETPRGATWVRPLLAVATVLPLLAMVTHLDPVCTVTTADGTVVRSYEYEQAPTGWSLNLGSSSSTTSTDGEATTCTNNTIVPWESGLSLALSLLYVLAVARLWPTAEQLARDPASSDRPA